MTLLLSFGCGAIDNQTDVGATDGGASNDRVVGVPTKDGAPGVCCPPSTGGCASPGGYSATGQCPVKICDNMCEQRIVDDDHGCKKLTYGHPPVATSYAGTEPCSDPRFNGGWGKDGGAKTDGASGPPPPVCDYPPNTNDPRCPPSFAYAYLGKACPAIGIACTYAGEGEGSPGLCSPPAFLWCVGDAGFVDDAGADAGAGTWFVSI